MLIDSKENKEKILKEFLEICVFEGWNKKALEEAFVKAGVDVKFLNFIFENDCVDVADFFVRQIDEKMIEKAAELDFTQMKIRDKIRNLVKIRLKINEQYKPQVKQLVSFYLNPKNSHHALTNAYKTADLMWKIAGDTATDFNFYSKRAILTKIYIRVLYSFANDNSNNYQKTLDLLDSEIEKVMKFGAFKFKMKNHLHQTSERLKKIKEIKNDFCSNPKNFIKNLPFFRLYK